MGSPDMSHELSAADRKISGRSLLENDAVLAGRPRETLSKNKKPYGEIIRDDEGNEAWREDIRYERVEDPEGSGQWRDTDAVKAIVEQKFTRDDQGRVTTIEGTNTDRVHSWKEAREYDDAGNVASESGEVTEGEKQGETWEKTSTTEQKGDYTVKTETQRTKKKVGKELVDSETVKVKCYDNEGHEVWGEQDTTTGGEQEPHMEWGKKPADLEE